MSCSSFALLALILLPFLRRGLVVLVSVGNFHDHGLALFGYLTLWSFASLTFCLEHSTHQLFRESELDFVEGSLFATLFLELFVSTYSRSIILRCFVLVHLIVQAFSSLSVSRCARMCVSLHVFLWRVLRQVELSRRH